MGGDTNEKEKCFVIMPISDQGDYTAGHFDKVYEQIFKPAIEEAGYESYRVDENKICDSIIGKIFHAVQECPMALCDLSNRNPNVLYELGIRQAYDKPVVLVQDEKTERIFDVSGINTVQYSSKRLYDEVLRDRKNITDAIRSTKAGEQNSITKVVSIKNAEIPNVSVSKEDKIELMLSGLIDDVNELKRDKFLRYDRFNSNLDLNDQRIDMRKNFDAEREGVFSVRFEVILKNGVTNKTVDMTMERVMRTLPEVAIHWARQGGSVIINVESMSIGKINIVRDIIENELGDIGRVLKV